MLGMAIGRLAARFVGRGARLGELSFMPRAFAAAKAALVRTEIIARSFSASAAYKWSTNGSTSGPSSATTKRTRWVISPR
jgi:hypothetical protein